MSNPSTLRAKSSTDACTAGSNAGRLSSARYRQSCRLVSVDQQAIVADALPRQPQIHRQFARRVVEADRAIFFAMHELVHERVV